jgi:hypothetical protein
LVSSPIPDLPLSATLKVWEVDMRLATALAVTSLCLAGTTIGCAHGSGGMESAPEAVTIPSDRACFNVREVESYDAFDDRFVAVKTIRDECYLLTLDNVCYGMESAIRIAISNDFNRVCSNDLAEITYRDFNRLHRCRILNVEQVDNLEAARDLWRSRRHGH